MLADRSLAGKSNVYTKRRNHNSQQVYIFTPIAKAEHGCQARIRMEWHWLGVLRRVDWAGGRVALTGRLPQRGFRV